MSSTVVHCLAVSWLVCGLGLFARSRPSPQINSSWNDWRSATRTSTVDALSLELVMTELSGPARGQRAVTVWLMRPSSFRAEQILASGKYVRTYHRGVATIDGVAAPSAEAYDNIRRDAAHWLLLVLAEPTTRAQSTSSAPSDLATSAGTLEFQLDKIGRFIVEIDAKSSRVARLTYVPAAGLRSAGAAPHTIVDDVQSYQSVDGVWIPRHIRRRDGDVSRLLELRSVRLNPGWTTAYFAQHRSQ